mmetsp:Transcript_61397/g.146401  ORF Transcript_61397/g.146401 Transcript_61397/m.146401 type:complete len:228 (+) Transcript_61397:261-944(+)
MPVPPLSSRETYLHHSWLCCSKRKALICSTQAGCPSSALWLSLATATICNSAVAYSSTSGFRARANLMMQGASSVSWRTKSRTSSWPRRHWKAKRSCTTISSSSRFSISRSCIMAGSRDSATCCTDSRQQARLLMSRMHSKTTSSSENPGTSSRVRSSTSPASQSSPQTTSSTVTLAKVPRTSRSSSGLSTEVSAMRTNSVIHLAMRTPSLARRSSICSRTPGCEAT